MEYSAIKLQTLTLLAEIAEGSSTYSDEQIADSIQWAQEETTRLLGLTFVESAIGVTAATGLQGATGVMGVVAPDDAIRVTRVQVWDSSMTDLVGD